MKRQKFRKALLLISFLLFPITIFYLSPVLIIEEASKGILVGSGLVFVTLALSAIIFGRGFCSWICPGGGLQEACLIAQEKKVNLKGDIIKWAIWTPWIISIILLFTKAGGILSIDFFSHTLYGISLYNLLGLIPYYTVIILVVSFAFAGGKRAFCHYVCWMAPFLIIGDSIKRKIGFGLRLEINPSTCVSCGACAKKCPMSLPIDDIVKENRQNHRECILCGECIDTCKKGAIKYKFLK